MKSFTSALLLGLAVVGLTACDETVETPNGEVPAEYAEQAQAYMGDYEGKFEGERGTLRLSMVGNKPMVQFIAQRGSNDLAGEGCESAVGNLVKVGVKKKNDMPVVNTATFEFDPGNCVMIEGRTLVLDFDHNRDGSPKKVSASIYSHTTWHWQPGRCFHDRWGGYCEPGRNEQYPYYLQGSFRK